MAFSASGIDVQSGANPRSYVRYLDVLFSNAAELAAWPAVGRVAVERFGIDATSVLPGTGAVVAGPVSTKDGSKLKLDFGLDGLVGLRQAGNGFYRVRLDINGNEIVNTTDRLYSTQQRGKKLLDPLLGWLDD